MFCKTGILSPFTEILEDHHQLLWGGCVVVCRQVIKPEFDNFGFQIKQSLNCSTCNRVVRKLRRTHQTTQYPHGPWREPQGSGDMIIKEGREILCKKTLSAYFSWCSIQARAATSGGMSAWSAWFGSLNPRMTSCSGPTSGSVVFAQ